MKINLKCVWDALGVSGTEKFCSQRYSKRMVFPSHRTYFEATGQTEGGQTYRKRNYVVPYTCSIWFEAQSVKGDRNLFVVTQYSHNVIDEPWRGYYDKEKSPKKKVLYNLEGECVFKREDLSHIMRFLEDKIKEVGFHLSPERQPKPERLASSLG